MAKFMPNAITLYKEGGPIVIDGKAAQARIFDRDSPTFDEDSRGWKTHEEMWAPEPQPQRKSAKTGV